MTPEQRAAVIAEARTWLRTAYHHHGRVKRVSGDDRGGVDCATFLIEVYTRAGIITGHDPGYYSTQWHLHRSEEKYLAQILKFCRPTDTPAPADIALFKFGRCYAHAAIVLDWPDVIHTFNPGGCMLGNAGQDALNGRPHRFFTLKEGA